jgi:translation initiation factor IF-3
MRIRVPEVRVVDADGNQLGIMPTSRARMLADQKGLDLVEVAPTAQPPVCRIMDYGKFKYDQEKKERDAKKHQVQTRVKEVKFHANVEDHDYMTKLRHTRDFIMEGHRVKVSLYFRGRENAHHELGYEVLKRVLKDCEDIATPEQMPNLLGKLLIMMIGPRRGLRQQQQTVQQTAPKPPPAAPAPAKGGPAPARA